MKTPPFAAIVGYIIALMSGAAVTLNLLGISWGPAVASGLMSVIALYTGTGGAALHLSANTKVTPPKETGNGT